jgi:hypothetical protein
VTSSPTLIAQIIPFAQRLALAVAVRGEGC